MQITPLPGLLLDKSTGHQTVAAAQLGVGLQRLTVVIKDQDDPGKTAERHRQDAETNFESVLRQTMVNPTAVTEHQTETELRRRNPYVGRRRRRAEDGATGTIIDLLA
ncbi:MAG: hypothetical protein HUU49_01670 [Candidatus Buchananbacteria bacterium]|nr:hypothetical protein [Candidatus Buchananbacteria bacterium]